MAHTSKPRTTLAVLDMAGTTVADDGLVEHAFTEAVGTLGVTADDERYPDMLAHVRATMGESKIVVFRHLFGEESLAHKANEAFEAAYARDVERGAVTEIAGAADAIDRLRTAGVRVALTTGFSATTQRAILDALGWRELADLTLCPADAGRGRPYPDLALTALLRLGLADVRTIATVGDTAYDVLAGLRAGAWLAAGVLTGAHDREQLTEAGATHVLDSVVDFCTVVLAE
ncbi:MAG: HAD hydrolase-like protein [Sciscionella sp.]|nr:HAD hydrolase-like protein [Sciscionella sp.]